MKNQELQAERDYFRAAYERKLNEHSETLKDAAQLCKERDEWQALAAKLRAALDGVQVYAIHGLGAISSQAGHDHEECTCANCLTGNARISAMSDALANTPADSPESIRAEAGRERALQELDALIEKTKRLGHSVTLAASTEPWDFSTKTEQALLLTFLEQRRAEIDGVFDVFSDAKAAAVSLALSQSEPGGVSGLIRS